MGRLLKDIEGKWALAKSVLAACSALLHHTRRRMPDVAVLPAESLTRRIPFSVPRLL
jgi:hypothetical protein